MLVLGLGRGTLTHHHFCRWYINLSNRHNYPFYAFSKPATKLWLEENEEYAEAKTVVWWDMNNTPPFCESLSFRYNFFRSLLWAGYRGSITNIYGFGDKYRITAPTWNNLVVSGDTYIHVPAGDKDANFNTILTNFQVVSRTYPPPANHLLIASDVRFKDELIKLKMDKYRVLLVRPSFAFNELDDVACRVWNWEDFEEGKPPLPPNTK